MPPSGYPSWADALEDGYKISNREKCDLIEAIEHTHEMMREMYEKFVNDN